MSDNEDWFPTKKEEREPFWQKFHQAINPGATQELADFIRDPNARAQLPDKAWLALAAWIESLDSKKRLPGNPYNAPNIEVRKAARRVDNSKVRWRRRHGNKRFVPKDDTDGFIDDAIKRIADKRGVVIRRDSGLYANLERQIRTALKGRHF